MWQSRWRHAGKRGIDDSVWGIAALVIAVIILIWLSPRLIRRIREGAREAGGIKGEFDKGVQDAKNAASATPAAKR